MKSRLMFLMFVFILATLQTRSQIKISSVDVEMGWLHSTKNLPISTSGLTSAVGITTSVNKNLFILDLEGSTGFLNLWDADYETKQYNLLYGRYFQVSKLIALQPGIGIGIVKEKYKYGDTDFKYLTTTTGGFPVKLKVFFANTKHLYVGIGSSVNVNSIATNYSASFLFQWRFINKGQLTTSVADAQLRAK
jgi:hypothetical protein